MQNDRKCTSCTRGHYFDGQHCRTCRYCFGTGKVLSEVEEAELRSRFSQFNRTASRDPDWEGLSPAENFHATEQLRLSFRITSQAA
jgi:hypothetical protein